MGTVRPRQVPPQNANSNSIKQNPAAKRNDPNPPKNPPRADWTGGVNDKAKGVRRQS
jgi:hypothetical protein